MRKSKVVVSWSEGLHARPSAQIAKVARKFVSTIKLECDGQIANARSFMSILLLCATVGSTLSIQAEGEDEERAIQAIQQVFDSE